MFKLEIDKELHLELIHFSHAKEMLALINDNRELFKKWFLWVDSVKSIEDEERFIRRSLERYTDGKLLNCMIFYKEKLVGSVEISMAKGYGIVKGELGYWLSAKFHGKGIMRRAAAKMIEIGFEHYKLDKIMLRCAVKNERSCNVAQKLGFIHEGRQRSEIVVNGTLMDVNVYAVLRDEYLQK